MIIVLFSKALNRIDVSVIEKTHVDESEIIERRKGLKDEGERPGGRWEPKRRSGIINGLPNPRLQPACLSRPYRPKFHHRTVGSVMRLIPPMLYPMG